MQLQKDAEQRRLMRGGRHGLEFFRIGMYVFLIIGVTALLWISLFHRKLYPIVFLTLWNLIVLSMIQLVSTQLAGIKQEEKI